MRNAVLASLILVLAIGSACFLATHAGPKGHLFIGGGDPDEPLMRLYFELAKGFGLGRTEGPSK